MDTFKKSFYVPIVKVDDEERMVYGWASTPEIDSDGEIIKSEAFEKALPNYMKFPTLREMHQAKVAGTTKQADISKKGLYIGAKVVADEAWKFVKEGLYKGFSIGGNVIRRVGNVIHELELVEISLVDVPANKGAVVELWKGGKFTENAAVVYSVFAGKTSEELMAKVGFLETVDLGDNKFADVLRKGVILAMKDKAEELKKEDKGSEEPKTEVVETPVAEEEPKDPKTPEETPKEEVKAEETPEETTPEEPKETGAVAETLTKIQEADAALEKLTPTPKVEKKDDGLAKAVDSLAGTLVKVTSVIAALEDRLAKVEAQPAAPKSRSAIVHKTAAEEPKAPEASGEVASVLEKNKARLAELSKLFDEIGASKFAKEGHSMEAAKLMKENQILSAQG